MTDAASGAASMASLDSILNLFSPSGQSHYFHRRSGSDVKELTIVAPPAKENQAPPKVPDDPAILGVSEESRSILFDFCDEHMDIHFSPSEHSC